MLVGEFASYSGGLTRILHQFVAVVLYLVTGWLLASFLQKLVVSQK
jgi:hypothetical protein